MTMARLKSKKLKIILVYNKVTIKVYVPHVKTKFIIARDFEALN